jgi:argininosuccinate lyase
MKINPQRMLQSIHPSLMATDLADYFVEMGLPFRQAHTLVGKAVQLAQSQGKNLDQLSLDEYRRLAEDLPSLPIDEALYKAFDPISSISRRNSTGVHRRTRWRNSSNRPDEH